MPVYLCVGAKDCSPVSLHDSDVLLGSVFAVFAESLQLVVEVFRLVVGTSVCISVILNGAALRRVDMSLLEIGRHLMTVFTAFL